MFWADPPASAISSWNSPRETGTYIITLHFLSLISCRFSISMSYPDALTYDDSSCLTRCHRALVPNSCHSSELRYPSPWRHIHALRAWTNPFRRFRHVTVIPDISHG